MSFDDMNRNRRNPSNGETSEPADGIHPAVEIMSEYLDRSPELTQAEREAIDRHLGDCEQCQRVLAELQLMVRTLGSLPEMEAPRSFTLRPEAAQAAMAPERPAPVVLQESAQWHARHAGKVRWATAVAAVLFVFVVSADLMTNSLRGIDDSAPGNGGEQMEVMRSVSATPADEGTGADGSDAARESADEVPASDEAVPESEDSAVSNADEEVPESTDSPAADDESETGTFMVPDEDTAGADEDAGDQQALTMEEEAISDEPASDPQAGGDSSRSLWRIAQVSLALVLALLLTVMIGLPRQHGRRRR